MLSLIVAVAENNAIGKDNDLIWHIPKDLEFFKEKTLGKTIIMGRKTFQSLPKVLPKRKHIVLTTNPEFTHPEVEISRSFEDTVQAYAGIPEEVFVIGGADIYKKALPFCKYLYITWVKKSFDADTFFPEFDRADYAVTEQSPIFTDEKSGLKFEFVTYKNTKL